VYITIIYTNDKGAIDHDGWWNGKARRLFSWIAKIFADGGYSGAKLKAALAGQPVELEIVKRTDNEVGFKVVRRVRRNTAMKSAGLKTRARLQFGVNRGLRRTVQKFEDGEPQVIEVKSA